MLFLLCARYIHMCGVLQIPIFSAQFYQSHVSVDGLLSDQDKCAQMINVVKNVVKISLGIGPKSEKECATYLDERNKIQILIESLQIAQNKNHVHNVWNIFLYAKIYYI